MSVRIASCWISLNILLGFILFVGGEHFYLPKENNVFSNDLQDEWVPISGIDKRSTRLNQGLTKVVHITPPIRYPSRSSNQQAMAASNKVEVFAQPPPTILGSFSEFGHATIEAREPAHTLNFRPSYHFERHYDEINDRRYQQNDYQDPEDQTPPAIVVFNAQQRHPQNYLKSTPPPQFYQNFPHHNHKNFGFKEPPAIQEAAALPKRLTPYFVPNDHIFPRPVPQQGNSKQVYAEQRPNPFLVTSAEPIQQQQQQFYQQPQQQQQQQQQQQYNRQPQLQQQQQQQQQQPQKQQFKTSTTDGVQSSSYFQKYPGQVFDGPNLFPQVSNFARPFVQTNDHSVYIKPNQHVHNLNVGTEMRFGPPELPKKTAAPLQELTTVGITHPATRPFSKYQTPTPKNEELYRIFPVKEVNALPAFLPTPITLQTLKTIHGRPKETAGGSSEYDVAQNENDSGEQYDIMRSPTKPMVTTTTTLAPPPPPRLTRKRKPSTTTTTTTTTTTAAPPPPPDDYDEYAVPNRQQLQLQEHQPQHQEYEPQQQEYEPQQLQQYQHRYEPPTTVTEAANKEEIPVVPVSVNKYKKKKPLPAARPKEPQQPEESDGSPPERAVSVPSSTTTATTTTTILTPTTVTATAVATPLSSVEAASTDVRTKTKLKYGNGTRPRFSIKDYKTTTTSTTTSTEKAPSGRRATTTTTTSTTTIPASTERKPYRPRPRPNRYRTTTTTTSTEEPFEREAEPTTTTTSTDRTAYRSKYKPGKYYNRLRTSTTESAALADEGGETAAAATAEPTRPAVYSAKRRTVPTAAKVTATASSTEENNALRRSSSAAPLIGGGEGEDALDVASSEDVDYVTTTSVTPSPTAAAAPPRQKYHTSYAADRPLLPIESFFQSSMTGKRHRHTERR